MDQGQNNYNQNGFNTQSNNELPQNQPLENNNQYAQQNVNVNQPVFNNLQQATSNYQQPLNEINTPQYSSSLGNGSDMNQQSNPESPKKKKLWLIIGLIILILLIIIVVFFVLQKEENTNISNKENNNSSNNSSNKETNLKEKDISQISITKSDIVALTTNGDLYHIGQVAVNISEKENTLKK